MGIDFTTFDGADSPLEPEVLLPLAPKGKPGRKWGSKNPPGVHRGPKDSPLTPKEMKACHEFVACGNKTEAVRRAGYEVKEENRSQLAYSLFRKPKIAAYLQSLQKKEIDKTDNLAEKVIDELKRLGFSTIDEYLSFDSNGVTLKKSKEMTPAALAAIESIQQKDTQFGTSIKFKLHSKIDALKLLAVHLGLMKEQIEIGIRPVFTFGDEEPPQKQASN